MPEASPILNDLKIDSTDDGLNLRGSILWLDSKSTGQLSFLSQAFENTKKIAPQIISTEITAKILEVFMKKPNALVCQYNRPFSIGQLKMEVIPSGHALGGASLFVETPKNSILYAPHAQVSKHSCSRKLQLKCADTLILSAQTPEPNIPAQKQRIKERENLLAHTKSLIASQKMPFVICKGMPIAQELTQLFTDHNIPTSVHQQIYKINKIYESNGPDLGAYSLYNQRRSRTKLVILPKSVARRGSFPLGTGRPCLYVGENIQDQGLNLNRVKAEASFELHAASYGTDYFEIIEKVKPKELFFFGQYAKTYSEFYQKSLSMTVRPLFSNDQPPLL